MAEIGTSERHHGGVRRWIRALPARGRLLAGTVTVTIAAAAVSTLAAGEPKKLPGAALGSATVLHLERIALVVGLVLLLLIFLDRALMGELPVELSTTGARYADVARTSEAALEKLRRRVDQQDTLLIQEFGPRLEDLERLLGLDPEDESTTNDG